MRLLLSFAALVVALSFTACASVQSRVHERFDRVPPRTQVFSSAQREVFYAAQGALKAMDFQLSRTAEAQGIVNAFSRIRAGDGPRESRQYTLEVRLSNLGPAETEVAVLVREQIEGGLASGVGATDQPLKQHALYEVFYANLKQALTARTFPPPDEKKR
ncbi:MAG: hypothetical protein NTV51_00060 [Verrucomicrobia bacterium]|nr:hypothetical protein [Verrucomicrobiota bacterium]